MALLEQRFDALGESNDVAIEPLQLHVLTFSRDANHVDGSDSTCLRAYLVEIGDDLLLVGDGDVEPFQIGVGVEHLTQIFDVWNLEVDVASVDVLVLELLVEVADGERMAERVADESVDVHDFFFGLWGGMG